MISTSPTRIRMISVAVGVAMLGACKTPPLPPPPPPPPPPPAEVIPYRPLPPSSAAYIMNIPGRGPDGQRLTVLKNLNDDERLWYFRSAWNVAALNCTGPGEEPILEGYRSFLTNNAKTLKAVNQRLDKGFVKEYGNSRDAIAARERRMTVVYNYFALPPARVEFCQAALRVATAQAAMPKTDAAALVSANFVQFETPFENFFTAYEQYQRDSAAWDAQYGARYGASQPGYVAVQAARLSGVPQVGVSDPAATTIQPVVQAGAVTDAETGASIPVVPVPQQEQSVPVVQPVPEAPPKP